MIGHFTQRDIWQENIIGSHRNLNLRPFDFCLLARHVFANLYLITLPLLVASTMVNLAELTKTTTAIPSNINPLFPKNIICCKGKNCSSNIFSRTHFSNFRNCTMKKLFLLTYLLNLHAFYTPTHFQKKLTLFYLIFLVFCDWRCDCYFLINYFDECVLTNV